MPLQIGDSAPDFEAETTEGRIRFHEWLGSSWGVLFSHPKDFTPVCTTELGYMAKLKPEFDKRNTKIIGLSVDPVDNHKRWSSDIKETQGHAPNYPMIGDTELKVSKAWGMLPASLEGTCDGRTPADNQTVRNVFVVGPDKKIKLIIAYPMTTGRNFDEVLRVIDSLQLTAKHKVATPVNWKQGDDVIIAGSVSDDEAKVTYPQGWKSPRPYIRDRPATQGVTRRFTAIASTRFTGCAIGLTKRDNVRCFRAILGVTIHNAEASAFRSLASAVAPAIGLAGSGAGPTGGSSAAGTGAARAEFEADAQMVLEALLRSPRFVYPLKPARPGSNQCGLYLC